MAGITFGGLGNGFDFQSVITALVAAKQVPIDQLSSDQQARQSQLTDYQSLGTNLLKLQTAAAALDVRFLDVNGVAELLVARRLVLHAQLHVLADVAANAMLPKGGAKTFGEFQIARERPRLEHGGFRKHVLVSQLDCFADRTSRVADLEADVPEKIEDLLDDLRGVGGNASTLFLMEEHDVDVAEWIQLAPSVAAERDNRERRRGAAPGARGRTNRRLKNMLEKNVD